jgi:hypothetical protein
MNAIALWSPLYAQQMAIACVEGDCAEPVVGMMPWLCLGILGTSALAISNPSVGLIALAAPSLFSSLTLAVWSALDAPDEQQPVLNASLRQALETMVLLSVLWTVLWTLVLLWTLQKIRLLIQRITVKQLLMQNNNYFFLLLELVKAKAA